MNPKFSVVLTGLAERLKVVLQHWLVVVKRRLHDFLGELFNPSKPYSKIYTQKMSHNNKYTYLNFICTFLFKLHFLFHGVFFRFNVARVSFSIVF